MPQKIIKRNLSLVFEIFITELQVYAQYSIKMQ